MSFIRKTVGLMSCLCITAIGSIYLIGTAFFQTHLKMGTVINGFHCSFMTVEEASALFYREADSYALAVKTRNGGVEEISSEEAGLTFTGADEIKDIVQQQDSYLWFVPETEPVTLSANIYQIDPAVLKKSVWDLKCMEGLVKGKTAAIVNNNGTYQVSPGIRGTNIDGDLVYDVIEDAVINWAESVDLEAEGCYVDVKVKNEKALQKRCDFLNSIQDTVITYDFGDRKETVDMDTIEQSMIDKNFRITAKSVSSYVRSLCNKYDTVGKERKFLTFDDKAVLISGGDYGWKINVEETSKNLVDLISASTIDVVEPIYDQEAASRETNDIGYSYLEIDAAGGNVVLYIEGKPVVQTMAEIGHGVQNGFWVARPELDAVYFGSSSLHGVQNVAGGSVNAVSISDQNAADGIIARMRTSWPVIVYGVDNSAN